MKTGAPPPWVEQLVVGLEQESDPHEAPGGQSYALFDQQVRAVSSERFTRVVKDILNENGIQNGANLSFSFDPSFEELVIHQIAIHRGTNRMDRLDPEKFKIIQQETDLDRHIYNGALSAVLFLEDVQRGDRIEYSYTVRGANPVFHGRHVDSFLSRLFVPVKRLHFRLIWPEDRSLQWKSHGGAPEPEIRRSDGAREYVWDLRDQPAVVTEDDVPSWFTVFPWVQMSEFGSWSEVADWAAQLYVRTNLNAPELQQRIELLRQSGAAPEQQLAAALQFAQDGIRYHGIEFGPHSCRPTDPVTVLQRRFGDCKDKAFLLCTLLQGLGIEAVPVLVATGYRMTLPSLRPSPYDFDHVIVRAVTGGKTFWMDPTRSYQRGPVAERYLPDYTWGLPIQSGVTALASIPASVAGMPQSVTIETFRVGGQKQPTQLQVLDTWKGSDAEWMRAALASLGREGLAKSFLNDLARYHPDITPVGAMIVSDSTNSNTLSISRNYSISNFWVLSEDRQKYQCEFYPSSIHSWIEKPGTTIRKMPLDLSFPRQRTVHTEVLLPEKWPLTNFQKTIAGPAAELRIMRHWDGKILKMDYEYRSLTNCVPASLAAEHLKSLDLMNNALGYSLNWQSMDILRGSSRFNWPVTALAAFYSLALCVGAVFVYRRQPPLAPVIAKPPLMISSKDLNGLGGWLILVGLGLVANPLGIMVIIGQSCDSFSLLNWRALTSPGGVSYHFAWGPFLVFDLLGNITLLATHLFVLVLFFQKRRMFPPWYIGLFLLHLAVVTLEYAAAAVLNLSISTSLGDVVRTVMQSAIWISYMCMSRRVKETFVR